MSSDKLNRLVKHRDAILLAEIGALIHDLGKLSEEFVKSKCIEESGNWIHHTAILEYDVYKNIPYAKKAKQILESIKITLGNDSIRLYDFVLGHHKKQWENKDEREKTWEKPEVFTFKYPDYNKNNIFLKFIIASDAFDSEEDKSYSKDQQSICGVYKSTSFGFENEQIEMSKLTEERKKVYETIINWLDACDFNEIIRKRRKCLDEIKNSFSKALGETRRSANDVTLWDHSYMTASIMKALVAYKVLKSDFEVKSKEDIEKQKPFKIFAVGWNFFDFIRQSHKIPDVVGRIKILEKIKEEIRKIIEEKYALGNSIYDDDFGIYFLIPSILSENDLEEVKRDLFKVFNDKTNGILLPIFHIEKWKQDGEFRIGKLLTDAIKSMKRDIIRHKLNLIENPKWIDEWKSSENIELPKDRLICNVCGRGYYCKGEDEKICKTCGEIRKKGREHEPPQTVFIDEISWNPERKQYENVCLLIAKFDLDEWLNGKYVSSLFIRNPEKHYNDLNWEDGRTLSGLHGVLGKALGKKIKDNQWDEEAKEKVYKETKLFLLNKLNKIFIIKGRPIETIIQRVIEAIDQEIKAGRSLKDVIYSEKKDHTITKNCFNFKYLNNPIILKPPSPSRLMRIWNNTREFFENVSKLICLNVPIINECKIILEDNISNLTPNMAYILEIDGKEAGEVISLKKESKELFVITPHTNEYLTENINEIKGKEITLKHPDSKRVIVKNKKIIKNIEKDGRVVRAYRIISLSPTLFMAIIPASVSLDIVKMMKKEYIKHFGKVFGKLPLHIGLIYFKRKMPIFTVLDSANRMINEFENRKSEIQLHVISNLAHEDNYIVTFSKKLLLDNNSREIKYKIEIPYKLGDGNVDYYHPYLVVESHSDDVIELKIDEDTILQKHISKIKKDDKIKVKEYCFDFELLDSNVRRFDIGVRRKHWLFTESENKPKPYLLWDIDNFERLRNLIRKLGLTNTQIMNLYEMLLSKLDEWGIRKPPAELLSSENKENKEKAKVFERLVDSAIKSVPLRLEIVNGESSKGKISKEDFEFLKNSIMSGLFFDFVDLWHTILKKEFGGDESV